MSFKPPRSLGPPAAAAALDALQDEVMQEKAATLGRLTHAFESALAVLREAETGATEGSGAPASRQREALVDAAAEALWNFVVQREACGLRNTEAVLREYCVPAGVRLRMGVSRRR